MEEMNAAMEAAMTPAVELWVNWMGIISLLSIIFVWKHKPARFVLLSLFLIFPLVFLIFKLTNTVHLVGIAHIVIWGPLAFYLIKHVIRADNFKLKSPYGIWLGLFTLTIAISLVFDVRDVILVMLGLK